MPPHVLPILDDREAHDNPALVKEPPHEVGHVEAFIVWEDDLICVPGTYAWLCAALRRYAGDQRVMSVTAWNHPRVTPGDLADQSYFDARAECWVWGAYARSWQGLDETAMQKLAACNASGVAGDAYGADLPAMARDESRKNIWAVRWLYHHLQHGGICLRPPVSLVEHIGFDDSATNAGPDANNWNNPSLPATVRVPTKWPEPREHPDCAALWRHAYPRQTLIRRLFRAIRQRLRILG